MSKPNEDLVQRILAKSERGKLLRAAISDSWGAFLEQYPQRTWWRRKSTRAALVWEHSVQNAIDAFEKDVGVKAIPHDDTVSFVFDQTVLIRFKKVDMELRSSNVPTMLSSIFHRHEEALPGFEDLQRVEAAYVLNQFQTNIDWIGIVARENKRVLWQFELEGGGVVERLPLPSAPKETAAERVMHPKKPVEETREDENQ